MEQYTPPELVSYRMHGLGTVRPSGALPDHTLNRERCKRRNRKGKWMVKGNLLAFPLSNPEIL